VVTNTTPMRICLAVFWNGLFFRPYQSKRRCLCATGAAATYISGCRATTWKGWSASRVGHTRVSGYRSQKKNHAFVTIATSVIEGLNVFDVLTADRVVAQVATSHPSRRAMI